MDWQFWNTVNNMNLWCSVELNKGLKGSCNSGGQERILHNYKVQSL